MRQSLVAAPSSARSRGVKGAVLLLLPATAALALAWTGIVAVPPLPMPWMDSGAASDGIAYLALPSIVVALGDESPARHLRFTATLEVLAEQKQRLEHALPRVVDVLNTFLNAVPPEDLMAHGAVVRLREQMLRRVEMVAGEDRIVDLLITEFLIN